MDEQDLRRNNLKSLQPSGMKDVDFAAKCGISPSYFSQILKGHRPFGEKTARKIEKALGLPRLALDRLSAFQSDGAEGHDNAASLGFAENTVPLFGWVKAGEWCESPDQFMPGGFEALLPRPPGTGPRAFALRVQNDSMTSPYPGQRSYPEGMIIYVDPDKPVTNGARVVARANGEYTFKAYVEDAGKKYLKPINPAYPTIDITEDVHICGVVIGSYLPE